jgi:hypothetical protein
MAIITIDEEGTEQRKNFHNPLDPPRNHGLLPRWYRLISQWAGVEWWKLSAEDKAKWTAPDFKEFTWGGAARNFISQSMWDHQSNIPVRAYPEAENGTPFGYISEHTAAKSENQVSISAEWTKIDGDFTGMWCAKLLGSERTDGTDYWNIKEMVPWYSQEVYDLSRNGDAGDHCNAITIIDRFPVVGTRRYSIELYSKPMRKEVCQTYIDVTFP